MIVVQCIGAVKLGLGKRSYWESKHHAMTSITPHSHHFFMVFPPGSFFVKPVSLVKYSHGVFTVRFPGDQEFNCVCQDGSSLLDLFCPIRFFDVAAIIVVQEKAASTAACLAIASRKQVICHPAVSSQRKEVQESRRRIVSAAEWNNVCYMLFVMAWDLQ
jgi:hypothetical protein